MANYLKANELPPTLDELTPIEKRLETEKENAENQFLNIISQLNLQIKEFGKVFDWFNKYITGVGYDIFKNAQDQVNSIKKIRNQIVHNFDLVNLPKKEEIESQISNLINLGKILNKEKSSLMRGRVAELSDYYKQDLYTNLKDKLFIFLPEDVKSELSIGNSTVFYIDEDFSKQLAILDISDDKIREWQNIINELGYGHSYKIINLNAQIKEVDEWMNNFSVSSSIGKLFVERGIPCKKSDNEFILNKVDNVTLDAGRSVNTFLTSEIDKISGHFKFVVRLVAGSILNFVIGFNKEDDNKYSWWIARLDTREPGGEQGCGILKKEAGRKWLPHDNDKRKSKKSFIKDKEVEVFLDFSETKIELYGFIKKKRKEEKIIWANKINRKEKIKSGQFGFFNELGSVELKILDNSTKK